MSFLSNAHTHTTYCDGHNAPMDMLEAARALGFVSLGFSGHAAQGFDWAYCMSDEEQEAYRVELRAMQARGRTGRSSPRLWVGLEQDSLAPDAAKTRNREQFDYIIGSTHYLTERCDGQYVAVDGDAERLDHAVQAQFGGDSVAMAEAYFALHGEALERDRPDIIGHFDLVRKYAPRLGLNTTDARYRAAALGALERAFRSGGVLELNTGGMARGSVDSPYPENFLLAAWRELGGEVTITSDCHDARYLDFCFRPSLLRLLSLGYRRVLRLGCGDALWEEVPLDGL